MSRFGKIVLIVALVLGGESCNQRKKKGEDVVCVQSVVNGFTDLNPFSDYNLTGCSATTSGSAGNKARPIVEEGPEGGQYVRFASVPPPPHALIIADKKKLLSIKIGEGLFPSTSSIVLNDNPRGPLYQFSEIDGVGFPFNVQICLSPGDENLVSFGMALFMGSTLVTVASMNSLATHHEAEFDLSYLCISMELTADDAESGISAGFVDSDLVELLLSTDDFDYDAGGSLSGPAEFEYFAVEDGQCTDRKVTLPVSDAATEGGVVCVSVKKNGVKVMRQVATKRNLRATGQAAPSIAKFGNDTICFLPHPSFPGKIFCKGVNAGMLGTTFAGSGWVAIDSTVDSSDGEPKICAVKESQGICYSRGTTEPLTFSGSAAGLTMGPTAHCIYTAGGENLCYGKFGTATIEPSNSPGVWDGPIRLAGNAFFGCGISSGDVYCFGSNITGGLGEKIPNGPTDFVVARENVGGLGIASVGYGHACVLDGITKSAVCWGSEGQGQFCGGTAGGVQGKAVAIAGVYNLAKAFGNKTYLISQAGLSVCDDPNRTSPKVLDTVGKWVDIYHVHDDTVAGYNVTGDPICIGNRDNLCDPNHDVTHPIKVTF